MNLSKLNKLCNFNFQIVKSLSPTEKYLLMRGYQAAEMKEHDKMVLSFNPSNFWNLVGSSPKNYSTVVLICDLNLDSNFYKEAMAKFREAASVHYNQYRKDSKNPWEESHPLFFVSLKINHEAEEKLDKVICIGFNNRIELHDRITCNFFCLFSINLIQPSLTLYSFLHPIIRNMYPSRSWTLTFQISWLIPDPSLKP